MTVDEMQQALLLWWNTQWALLHPGSGSDPADTTQAGCVPWCGRNESFAVDQLGPLQCWARITTIHTGSGQGTQGARGARKYQRTGVVKVQLFGTIDSGDKELGKLCEDAITALQGLTIGGEFTLYAGTPAEIDEPDGSPWAGMVVSFDFRYSAAG